MPTLAITLLVLLKCSHQPLCQDPCRDLVLYQVILALQNEGDIKYHEVY